MKRIGSTTVLKHMIFESCIFQFDKTPNGRFTMLDKKSQHKLLKGMSPDLFDNVIMLCGGTCYDCYRMLRDDAGIIKKQLRAEDMMAMLNVNGDVTQGMDTRIRHTQKIKNVSDDVLNILSTI